MICDHINNRFNRDGAEKSGLLCVVSVVLERMQVEQDVAIGHVIEELSGADNSNTGKTMLTLSNLLLKYCSINYAVSSFVTMGNRAY